MSPKLRQALHAALDHILDAVAEEAGSTKPTTKRRTKAPPVVDLSTVSNETRDKARKALLKAGLL